MKSIHWILMGLFFTIALGGILAILFVDSDKGVMVCAGVAIGGMFLLVINTIVAIIRQPS